MNSSRYPYFTFALLIISFTISSKNLYYPTPSHGLTNTSLSWEKGQATYSLVFLATNALYKEPSLHLCRTKTSSASSSSFFCALPRKMMRSLTHMICNDISCFMRIKATRGNESDSIITAIQESLSQENDGFSIALISFFSHIKAERRKMKYNSSHLKQLYPAGSQCITPLKNIDFGHYAEKD